jgi:hypothetical protein
MNERIKELADVAAKYSAIMALPTGQSGNELFVEKFAELIVRECAGIAAGNQAEDMDWSIGDFIRERFGVTE